MLQPFLPADIDDQFFDVAIREVVNKGVQAMSASAFIDICTAYSARPRHRRAGMTKSQVAMAVRASMLLVRLRQDSASRPPFMR